jgi:two-component system chemotaxis response regulator CheB
MAGTSNARLVVLGASAGGVEALPTVLASLPARLEATVLIVQHLRRGSGEHLLGILQRRCALPVAWAENGRALEPGHVLVAPPDTHLLVDPHHMLLVGGPRENHARPSINRLFRSAAVHHDGRVIGVVLTGLLDDGSAGLVAIRRCGGIVVVQDPRDAAFPPMPRNAIEAVAPDAILPLDEIGPAIVRFLERAEGRAPIPADLALEAELDATARVDLEKTSLLGPQAPVSCPECGGPTWRAGGPTAQSYRCFVGHTSSAHTLLADKADEVQASLWRAVRALEERRVTLTSLARDSARSDVVAADYEAQSQKASEQARRALALLDELRRLESA